MEFHINILYFICCRAIQRQVLSLSFECVLSVCEYAIAALSMALLVSLVVSDYDNQIKINNHNNNQMSSVWFSAVASCDLVVLLWCVTRRSVPAPWWSPSWPEQGFEPRVFASCNLPVKTSLRSASVGTSLRILPMSNKNSRNSILPLPSESTCKHFSGYLEIFVISDLQRKIFH